MCYSTLATSIKRCLESGRNSYYNMHEMLVFLACDRVEATKDLNKFYERTGGEVYYVPHYDGTEDKVNELYTTGSDAKKNRQALLDAITPDLSDEQRNSNDYKRAVKLIKSMV